MSSHPDLQRGPPRDPSHRRSLRARGLASPSFLLRAAVLAATTYALGHFALRFAVDGGRVSLAYAPAGLAIAAALAWGARFLPAVATGAFVLGVRDQHLAPAEALECAAITASSAWIATRWLARARFDASFARARDAAAFLGLGVAAPALLTAALTAIVLASSGSVPIDRVGSVFACAWLGDALGALLFGGALLAWEAGARDDSRPRKTIDRARAAELVLLAAATAGSIALAFGDAGPAAGEGALRSLVLLPVVACVVWAASHGARVASATVLAIACVGGLETARGSGFVARAGLGDPSVATCAFSIALGGIALFLASARREVRSSNEALRAAAERFELAVSGSSGGLWEWDLDRDRLELSPRFLELLGLDPSESVHRGELLRSVVHEDDHLVFDVAVKEHLEHGGCWEVDVRLRCADGGYRWFHARGVASCDRDGRPRRMAGSVGDVHDKKVVEDELARHVFALETARDLAERQAAELAHFVEELGDARSRAEAAAQAKSEFLATMSHEIRTPMNAVMGMTALLGDTQLADEQREMLATIRRSGEALLGLIDDVFDYAKLEAGELALEHAPFDLRAAARDVVAIFAPRARANGVAIELEWSVDVPERVVGDPCRVRQVLANLVGNAVKFTHAGAVRVVARAEDATPRAFTWVLEVRDTGIGIAKERLDDVFAAFTQADGSTSRRYGGTGLGLAITKRLVERMGGAIEVESELGAGSTFRVRLELAADHAPRPALPARTAHDELPREKVATVRAPMTGAARTRVLLVEDNVVNQRVAMRMLEKLGCTVRVANDGVEAIAALAEHSADGPELVLMDCMMPELDGYDATRRWREKERGSRVPIVAMTAHALRGDREKCLGAGMDDYVTKPVRVEELERVLARWTKRESATR